MVQKYKFDIYGQIYNIWPKIEKKEENEKKDAVFKRVHTFVHNDPINDFRASYDFTA